MTSLLPVPLDQNASLMSALARLPAASTGVPELDADPAWRLAAAFLLGYRGHTRRAYFADIRAWYAWCAGIDLPPLAAQRHDVDRWIAEQLDHPQPGTGRPVAAATVTRRLSCLSGLYEYAVVDAGPVCAGQGSDRWSWAAGGAGLLRHTADCRDNRLVAGILPVPHG